MVFIVGEIDCREGFLRAVERDLYPSIEAAMRNTASVYSSVLKQVHAMKPNLKVDLAIHSCRLYGLLLENGHDLPYIIFVLN